MSLHLSPNYSKINVMHNAHTMQNAKCTMQNVSVIERTLASLFEGGDRALARSEGVSLVYRTLPQSACSADSPLREGAEMSIVNWENGLPQAALLPSQ